MIHPVRAPMSECPRGPLAPTLVRFPVRVAGTGCVVTVSPYELHLAFTDCEGPNFVLSLPDLAQAMAAAAEATIWGLPHE